MERLGSALQAPRASSPAAPAAPRDGGPGQAAQQQLAPASGGGGAEPSCALSRQLENLAKARQAVADRAREIANLQARLESVRQRQERAINQRTAALEALEAEAVRMGVRVKFEINDKP